MMILSTVTLRSSSFQQCFRRRRRLQLQWCSSSAPVLDEARTFAEARPVLCETPIPCDCLLLLTGVAAGELAVIERTPARFAIRGPNSGFIALTNG